MLQKVTIFLEIIGNFLIDVIWKNYWKYECMESETLKVTVTPICSSSIKSEVNYFWKHFGFEEYCLLRQVEEWKVCIFHYFLWDFLESEFIFWFLVLWSRNKKYIEFKTHDIWVLPLFIWISLKNCFKSVYTGVLFYISTVHDNLL